jgi:hypothetical protein
VAVRKPKAVGHLVKGVDGSGAYRRAVGRLFARLVERHVKEVVVIAELARPRLARVHRLGHLPERVVIVKFPCLTGGRPKESDYDQSRQNTLLNVSHT